MCLSHQSQGWEYPKIKTFGHSPMENGGMASLYNNVKI